MNEKWMEEETESESKNTFCQKLFELGKKNPTEFIISGLALIFGLLIIKPWSPDYALEKVPTKTVSDLGTLIPKGFQVIPISISNKEAIKSLVGRHGYVDLYSKNSSQQKSKLQLVVKSVRLIQAPLDENQYAVLCNESVGRHILNFEGPFTVIINSSASDSHEKVNSNKKRISRITQGVDL